MDCGILMVAIAVLSIAASILVAMAIAVRDALSAASEALHSDLSQHYAINTGS
jgi:hypothetical protein